MTTVVQEPIFRVYNLPKQLKVQVSTAREKRGIRQKVLIQSAVDDHLDFVVAALTTAGITAGKNLGPCRYPVSEPLLKKLRQASNTTGIAASALLAASLSLATSTAKPRKGQRKVSARKRSGASQTTTKAKGTQRKSSRRTRKGMKA